MHSHTNTHTYKHTDTHTHTLTLTHTYSHGGQKQLQETRRALTEGLRTPILKIMFVKTPSEDLNTVPYEKSSCTKPLC